MAGANRKVKICKEKTETYEHADPFPPQLFPSSFTLGAPRGENPTPAGFSEGESSPLQGGE